MNKRTLLSFVLFILIASGIVAIPPIKANSKIITVPDDYPTITAAIENATDGDTIFVKKGTYEEHMLAINASISLVGEDAHNTIIRNIDPAYLGSWPRLLGSAPVQINAQGVTLTNFTLTDGLIGVYVNSNGTRLIGNTIKNCTSGVSLTSSYNVFANNTIEGMGNFNIYVTGSCNSITGNRIIGTPVEGIDVAGADNTFYGNAIIGTGWYGFKIRLNVTGNLIAKNNITGCTGIFMDWGSSTVICANRITDGGVGIILFMGYNNTIYANHFENNTMGVLLGYDMTDIARQLGGPSAANNIIYHNNFVVNAQQALDWNWLATNNWTYGGEGNFWSDYNGTDSNNDGVGDTRYCLSEANSFYAPSTQNVDLYPLMVPFNIFTVNISLPEWKFQLPSPTLSPASSPTPSPSVSSSPFPSLTSSPSSAPSLSPTPTPSSIPLPSQSTLPSQGSTKSPEPPLYLSLTSEVAIAIVVSAIVVIVALAVFVFRKRAQK